MNEPFPLKRVLQFSLVSSVILLVAYIVGLKYPTITDYILTGLSLGTLFFIAWVIRIGIYYLFIKNMEVQTVFILGGILISALSTLYQFGFITLMGQSASSDSIIVLFVLSNTVFMLIESVFLEHFWKIKTVSLRRSMAFVHDVFTFCSVFIWMLYWQMI